MNRKNILSKSVFFFALIFGLLIGCMSYATIRNIRNQGEAPVPNYPKNDSGETFGSALNAISRETEPDLIKAISEDGTIGYVRKTDLEGDLPKTPAEALEMQKANKNVREITLYDTDGKKVLGKFKIKPGKKENIKIK